MNPSQWLRIAGAGLIAVIICSCETLPEGPYPRAAAAGWWNDDGASGPAKIVVHIGEQKAYFYKGKRLVGESTVSTGKPGFSTPPGSYSVLSKSPDHVSTIFGDYVDDYGNVVRSNIDARKDRRPPGSHFDGAQMPYAMFLGAATPCIRAMCRLLPLLTVVFACRKEWRKHFTRTRPSAHR